MKVIFQVGVGFFRPVKYSLNLRMQVVPEVGDVVTIGDNVFKVTHRSFAFTFDERSLFITLRQKDRNHLDSDFGWETLTESANRLAASRFI